MPTLRAALLKQNPGFNNFLRSKNRSKLIMVRITTSHFPTLPTSQHFPLPNTSHHFPLPTTSYYLRFTRSTSYHFLLPITSYFLSLPTSYHFLLSYCFPVNALFTYFSDSCIIVVSYLQEGMKNVSKHIRGQTTT